MAWAIPLPAAAEAERGSAAVRLGPEGLRSRPRGGVLGGSGGVGGLAGLGSGRRLGRRGRRKGGGRGARRAGRTGGGRGVGGEGLGQEGLAGHDEGGCGGVGGEQPVGGGPHRQSLIDNH